MIIAVDYDGTLEIGGTVNTPLIKRLKAAQSSGNAVILWTCRSGKRLLDALETLRSAGFVPTLVNENHPAAIARLRCNPRKINADVYIDDKNGVF